MPVQVLSARWLDAGQTMLHVEYDDGAQISGTRPFAAPYDAAYADWTGTTQAAPSEAVDLAAYAAAVRYAKETGGITVGGAAILTDRASQAMITGAYNGVTRDPSAEISFKSATGWVTLSAEQMVGIASAVFAHVQACFAAERAVEAAITAGTITTTAEIDAYAWPPNG